MSPVDFLWVPAPGDHRRLQAPSDLRWLFVAAGVAHQLHRFGLTRVQGAEGAGDGHKRHAVDE